jgi:hypothetical protein
MDGARAELTNRIEAREIRSFSKILDSSRRFIDKAGKADYDPEFSTLRR